MSVMLLHGNHGGNRKGVEKGRLVRMGWGRYERPLRKGGAEAP